MHPYRFQLPSPALTAILLAVIFCLMLQGCDDSPAPLFAPPKTLATIPIDGFQVPVFPTAAEQFNYSHSWFDSQEEKRASLLAVARLFPEAREQRAEAALGLAYLLLGQDYRLAGPELCRQAIRGYRRVIEEFADLPGICAKAYWYMGWIFCDLLKDKEQGLEMYRTVVGRYPEVRLNLAPSAPWTTIVAPEKPETSRPREEPNQFWADIALLEIIRHSDEGALLRAAFAQLWSARRNDQIVGIALKLLLEKQAFAREAAPFARKYLQEKTANAALHGDIARALAGSAPPPAGRGGASR